MNGLEMDLKFPCRPQPALKFNRSQRSHKIFLDEGVCLPFAAAALAMAALEERQRCESVDYISGVTPQMATELVLQTANRNHLFSFDKILNRKVGIGARLNRDNSVTLVGMGGRHINFEKALMISYSANGFLRGFLDSKRE